jgi:formate dehydrogenase maturation protein FdhE
MLKSLRGRKELSDSYLNFQSDLLDMHQKLKQKDRLLDAAFPKSAVIKNRLNEGIPLLGFTPLSISLLALIEGYQNLIDIFTTHHIWTGKVSQWFIKQSNPAFVKKLSLAAISFNIKNLQVQAKNSPVDESTLLLMGRELIKPFMNFFAEQAGKVTSFDHYKAGLCPVCGDNPGMARISKDEDGKKYLWCTRCESEWAFPRITCPFCKNTDHTKLRFLSTNFREELRLDVCDICQSYTKTFDERKIDQEEKPDLFKENIASLYLDILAEDNGYYVQPPPTREIKIGFITDQ